MNTGHDALLTITLDDALNSNAVRTLESTAFARDRYSSSNASSARVMLGLRALKRSHRQLRCLRKLLGYLASQGTEKGHDLTNIVIRQLTP